jgi:DnaJ-domain-containing protein 1
VGGDSLVRVLYRLGRQAATGVLTVVHSPGGREALVLRRGHALGDKHLPIRLARLAAVQLTHVAFDGGVTGVSPPGAHGVPLARWARSHLEQQVDSARADALLRELAGIRLVLRPDLAPDPVDEPDRRMLAALAHPRRLDQIWPLARTSRFRLLALIHFLRAVDAVELVGVAASPPLPDLQELAARRLLGVDERADREAIKRAYRRLARAFHPDLQPDADDARRRTLARRFAEVTAAYEALS